MRAAPVAIGILGIVVRTAGCLIVRGVGGGVGSSNGTALATPGNCLHSCIMASRRLAGLADAILRWRSAVNWLDCSRCEGRALCFEVVVFSAILTLLVERVPR